MDDTPARPSASLRGLRVIFSTALLKVLVMGLSGVLGVVTSRVIITGYGVEAYAQYGLISTLPNLLPFADLGIAAIVLNTVAESSDPRHDERVRRALTSAIRVLLGSSVVIAFLGVGIHLLGWWPTLLGDGLLPGGGAVVSACLIVFALALPLSVGARILVGLNLTPRQTAAQFVIAPSILACVVLCSALGLQAGGLLPLFSYLAAALSGLLCVVMAARAIAPQFGRAVAAVPDVRRYPGVPLIGLAAPLLVQVIADAVALQTGRLQVSHIAGTDALAEYNLAAQLFGIALQAVAAAGLALWPIFAKARADGEVRSPFVIAALFMAVGLVLGGLIALASPLLSDLVSDGQISLSWPLLVGFVGFTAAQALKYPLGMYMTDARGLRFQVVPNLAMVPVSVGIGWWLAGQIGAGGPIIGAVVAVMICQVGPMAWYVHADLRARRRKTS